MDKNRREARKPSPSNTSTAAPRLSAAPLGYGVLRRAILKAAQKYTKRSVKQGVISASALSLLYPASGLPDDRKRNFWRTWPTKPSATSASAWTPERANAQIDFTEARLLLKRNPSLGLLRAFVDLNNKVLNRFTVEERKEIGAHTYPGGDRDATHSAEVDHTDLLPLLFELNAGRFYVQLAGEADQKLIKRRCWRRFAACCRPGRSCSLG